MIITNLCHSFEKFRQINSKKKSLKNVPFIFLDKMQIKLIVCSEIQRFHYIFKKIKKLVHAMRINPSR